jgi:spore coat protein U domain-containing protein, fimbrial subunit CupE1/2/3/6
MKRVILSLAATLLAAAGTQGAATCTVSTSGVAFGSYNALAGQSANTAGTISVTCMGNPGDSAAYTIAIASGSGSFTAREMASGANNLAYNLYRDSGCTQLWGDGTGSTYTVGDSMTLSSTSNTKNYVVYSRIASGQNTARAGIYSDNMMVTVTY